jgi:23S rRNA (cytosine1962-C5)-methyltransferase
LQEDEADVKQDKACESPFLENGLSFVAHIGQGQKTGHFLDQRENRALVKRYAKNRRVLDAFCYSGGFSVYALSGGASHVTSVDISERAIAYVQNHVKQNGPFASNHEAVVSDCFEYLRKQKVGDFDLIVLDPPAFAKSVATVEKAARGYKDINLVAMKALLPGSLLFTFSCSQHISVDLFKKIVFSAAKDLGKELVILQELGQGPDHPVSLFCPQSSYLKGLALYVK